MQGQFMEHYGHRILSQFSFWNDYRAFKSGPADYRRGLLENAGALREMGLNDWHISRLQFMPADDEQSVQTMIRGLIRQGAIAEPHYDRNGYQALRRRVYQTTQYGPFITYVMDDEALVAYALSDILRPRRVFCAGSYFGFWAQWLLPGVQKACGKAQLSDINPEAVALCRQNLAMLGLDGAADVRCQDAAELLRQSEETIDLLMLDATGPSDERRAQYRGKAVNVPIVQAALPRLQRGSAVLVHNHELDAPELSLLYDILGKMARYYVYMESYNCMGVYIL